MVEGEHVDQHAVEPVAQTHRGFFGLEVDVGCAGREAAREDDAEQAIRAGLEMLTALQAVRGEYAINLHIAIHSGAVLLGEPGRITGDEYPPWIMARHWQFERFAQPRPDGKPIRVYQLT